MTEIEIRLTTELKTANAKIDILKNEFIDMQGAIIGWHKGIAFNSEDDLIDALDEMIERSLKKD